MSVDRQTGTAASTVAEYELAEGYFDHVLQQFDGELDARDTAEIEALLDELETARDAVDNAYNSMLPYKRRKRDR